MSTWKEIGEKWHRAQQMGFQTIQALLDVGDELAEKKLETPEGEWIPKVTKMFNDTRAYHEPIISKNAARSKASILMRLALHRQLIEEQKPESMRQAIALLPKAVNKVGDKQIKKDKDDLEKYESYSKLTAKKQADILAKKRVKVELDRLQNQAHESITKELKAVKQKYEQERKRNFELRMEVEKLRQFYNDLVNKKLNGFDFNSGFKILKQAIHPDRENVSPRMRTKAMTVVKNLERFFSR